MLVQVYYTETVCTGQIFNEAIHRTSRDLEYEAWGEFLVVWRRDCVEIYEDYVCLNIIRWSDLLTQLYTRIFRCGSG
jgi:hypothetical protein